MAFFERVRERAQPARSGMVELTVFGDTQISRGFVSGAGRLRDLRPAWHHVHDWLLEENRRQFASEGSYGGNAWHQLAESTIRRKQAKGMDNGILRETDRLFGSMTEKGHPDAKVKITRRNFDFQSLVEYGEYHQTGTDTMVARPPFRINEAARKVPLGFVQRHVMGLL